jgi:hypothetical protein
MEFSYATEIGLLNGQRLNEYEDGIEINARTWNNGDFEQFPQAVNSLGVTECLVVDRETGVAYAVSVQEASDFKVCSDTIEIEEGVLGWAALI